MILYLQNVLQLRSTYIVHSRTNNEKRRTRRLIEGGEWGHSASALARRPPRSQYAPPSQLSRSRETCVYVCAFWVTMIHMSERERAVHLILSSVQERVARAEVSWYKKVPSHQNGSQNSNRGTHLTTTLKVHFKPSSHKSE